jgi:glycogen operon protein
MENDVDRDNGTGHVAAAQRRRSTWEQVEGSPLPLGVTWIEEEQAFNFAVYSELAESVTLLLYTAADIVNPLLAYRLDFLRNKSGRIWHCRIPLNEIGDARFYGYSVSGQAVSYIHSFDPQKVLLDPYAKCVFFPPEFDREKAMRKGQMRAKRRSACCRHDNRPSIGRESPLRFTSRTRLSMSFM